MASPAGLFYSGQFPCSGEELKMVQRSRLSPSEGISAGPPCHAMTALPSLRTQSYSQC
jgi:hypothetical protein